MFKELKPAFMMMLVMTVLTGLVYPAVITVIAQVMFPDQANGSLIVSNGHVVGSRLIGQSFSKPEYFQPRPSAAGGGYDPTASAGSNLGPTSAKFINGTTKKDDKGNEVADFIGVKARIVHYCLDNEIAYESSVPLDTFKDSQGNLDDAKLIDAFGDAKAPLVFTPKTSIPADAVTASASGLDPHISPANAQTQAIRVAKARGVSVDRVQGVIAQHTNGRSLGFLGEPAVNVLELNLDLDQRLPEEVIRRLRFFAVASLLGLAAFYAGTRLVTRPLVPPKHPITGRQIAGIATDAGWLDRATREQEEAPEQALQLIGIQPGMVVADVGAGTGYMTTRLAHLVGPTGKVYANDLQPAMLRIIEDKARAEHLENVTVIHGTETDARLPDGEIDLALLVDVYHELWHPQEMLRSIHRSLKTQGQLVLVEYRKEDPTIPISETHRMSVAEARVEIEAERFVFDRLVPGLPRQHIIVFRRMD